MGFGVVAPESGPDVKAIRAKTRLSQTKFAASLRVPVGTVRDWEQHRRSPDAPALSVHAELVELCWGWSMLILRRRWR